MARPFKITPLTAPGYWLDAIDPPAHTPQQKGLSAGRSTVNDATFRHPRDWGDDPESLTHWESYVVPYPDLLQSETAPSSICTSDHQRIERLNPDAAATTPMGRLWLRLLRLGCGLEVQATEPLFFTDTYPFR
ncbi:hypothetical protein [uncultured Fibrella sp.]|uniref:hypothetical protein n=1 Tax=uncultured Fibrella sp. TaxID=1284596 RepID=UPI0035CBE855